jgi:hypothetical protein
MIIAKLQPGTVFMYIPNCTDTDNEDDPCYATSGSNALVFRNISLENYPSGYDFFDPIPEIKEGSIGIIVRPLGMPHSLWLRKNIVNNPALKEKYTVYEAIICNEIVHVFSNDIQPLSCKIEALA